MPTDDTRNDRRHVVIDATASSGREFGTVVVNAIADELGVDPTSLPPIRRSIDPEVLNAFRDADEAASAALSFEYLGYKVVVTGDGLVQLRPLP